MSDCQGPRSVYIDPRHHEHQNSPEVIATQYDFTLNYVGHAETWDKLDLDRSIDEHDCKLSFRRGGKTLAVANIGRDRESLESELAMERAVQAG